MTCTAIYRTRYTATCMHDPFCPPPLTCPPPTHPSCLTRPCVGHRQSRQEPPRILQESTDISKQGMGIAAISAAEEGSGAHNGSDSSRPRRR